MNVGQLIEQLKTYPQDLRVVVAGYEGGYNDVDQFEKIKIVLEYHSEWYYGKHEDIDHISRFFSDNKTDAVEALRIG
jgi:hypothetical protein